MADRAISDLIAASQVTNSDLFVLEQNNTAKKLTGQILIRDLATALDGHGGISNISYTAPVAPSLNGTLTITMADGTVYTVSVTNGNGIANITQYWAVSEYNDSEPVTWEETLQTMTDEFRYLWSYTVYTFDDGSEIETIPQVIGVYGDTGHGWYVHIKYASRYPVADSDLGDSPDEWIGIYSGISETAPTSRTVYTWYQYKGERGFTGNGIASVVKTSSSGLQDVYTVTFTDGTTTTFTVTNGSSIQSITKTATDNLQDTYTVLLTNGQTTQFYVNNAKSIISVAWSSTTAPSGTPHVAGATDTYVISYNDGDTSSFQVYNGANGAGAVAKVDGIDAVGDNVPLLTIGNGAPTTATQGSIKSRYFDATNSILYICIAYDPNTGTYTWQGAGVTVDSALSTSSTNPVQNKVITNKVGTSTLTTTAQTLSGAVNELDAEIGDVSQLTTTATDLAGAVNEVDSEKVSKMGDTMTGNLVFTSSNLEDGVVPSANTDGYGFELVDKNGATIARVNPYFTTAGVQGIAIAARREINNTVYWNVLRLNIDNSGNPAILFGGNAANAWMDALGAVSKSGDTMTGVLEVLGKQIHPRSTNLTSGTVIASNANGDSDVRFKDSADNTIAYITPRFETDGTQKLRITTTRDVNGSAISNTLDLGIDSNGARSVNVGSAANAWMDALAGATLTHETSISSIITGSGATITSVDFVSWGKLAQIMITLELTAAISSATTVATVKSGYRPVVNAVAGASSRSISVARLGSNGGLWLNPNTTVASGSAITIYCTYLLA